MDSFQAKIVQSSGGARVVVADILRGITWEASTKWPPYNVPVACVSRKAEPFVATFCKGTRPSNVSLFDGALLGQWSLHGGLRLGRCKWILSESQTQRQYHLRETSLLRAVLRGVLTSENTSVVCTYREAEVARISTEAVPGLKWARGARFGPTAPDLRLLAGFSISVLLQMEHIVAHS